jgi:hypothetical protein
VKIAKAFIAFCIAEETINLELEKHQYLRMMRAKVRLRNEGALY